MGWPIADPGEKAELEPLSPWVFVGVTLLIVAVSIVLIMLFWLIGKSAEHSALFWLRLAFVPMLAAWICCATIVYIRDLTQYAVDLWNYYGRLLKVIWRTWASHHIVAQAYATLTPEPLLAERISGLSGSMPQNKGKVLKLAGFEPDHQESRTDKVARALFEQLGPSLLRVSSKQTIDVVVCLGEDHETTSDKERLTGLWASLALPLHAEFSVVGQFNWSNLEAFRAKGFGALVVLVVQLHDATKDTHSHTESAVALLFQHQPQKKADGQQPVLLFQPMHSDIGSLETDLKQLSEVGPYLANQLRGGWSCELDKAARYALAEGLSEVGVKLKGGTDGLFGLDDCLGPLGAISSWLGLALAAELVQYGQGAQLLASQKGETVTLLVAGTSLRQDDLALGAVPFRSQIGSGQLILSVPLAIFLTLWETKPAGSYWVYIALSAACLTIALVAGFIPAITARICASRFGGAFGHCPDHR